MESNETELYFENDKFTNLKIFGKQVIRILKNSGYYKKVPLYDSTDKGFTLAIDSRWGTGKTTFLKRLYNELNRDSGFGAIYYNAWESDDFDNALIPIVYNFAKHLTEINDSMNIGKLENICNKMHTITHYVGKAMSNTQITLSLPQTPINSSIQAGDIISAAKDIKNNSPIALDKDFYTEFKTYMELRDEFKKILKTIIPQTGKKRVVIIDELDRCRPTFAVETLEVVKHFFDNENIQFVFAVDIEQLSHSIATMYGQNMDASGYLRRFFDLQIQFPPISKIEFIKIQFNDSNVSNDRLLMNNLNNISLNLHLSLRDIEKYTSYLELLLKTSLRKLQNSNLISELSDCLSIYYFLIILNSKYSDFWNYVLTYNKDNNLDKFREDVAKDGVNKEYSIPSLYFTYDKEKLEPYAVVEFCRNFLLSSSLRNQKINTVRWDSESFINRDNLSFLGINNYNTDDTIIQCFQKNLSILALDIIKDT